MMGLAGGVAEFILTGRYDWVAAGPDRKSALDKVDLLTLGDTKESELYIELPLYRTVKLLRIPWNWSAVEELANELLSRETIKYNEARTIIKKAVSLSSQSARFQNAVAALS